MTRNDYIAAINKKRNEIFDMHFDEVKHLGFLKYLLISASIQRYLSHFKNEEHYRLIQEMHFNTDLGLIDQCYFDVVDELQVNDPDNLLEKSLFASHIFVTYHTGSYVLFMGALIKKNIPFCLVTAEAYINEKQQLVNNHINQYRQHLNRASSNELEIIAAEDPKLLFKLNHKLKNGVSVVFYIDGNTGANSDAKTNSNLLKIKFLDYFINARQGIALLAYLSKCPLVSALAMRHPDLSNSVDIKTIDNFLFTQMNRKDYAALMTEKLYAELEGFLRKHPEQWEGWSYLNSFKPEEELILPKSEF